MKPQSVPSYSQGALDKPLLAMTIGQAFDQTAARYPDGEALVVLNMDDAGNVGGAAAMSTLNLAGVFPLLPNVAWTSQGAIDLSELAERQLEARLRGELLR